MERRGSPYNGQGRRLDPKEKVKERKEIKSWEEVPPFASEKEEQAWWDEHDVSEELLETFEARSERGIACRRERTQ